jgi:orotidine-5'-phosphate decarboxylase
MNKDIGLLVNVSRGIIFLSANEHFASVAGSAAKEYQAELAKFLQ